MKKTLLALFVLALGCAKVASPSKVPGGGLKSLDRSDQEKLSTMLGSTGDVLHYMKGRSNLYFDLSGRMEVSDRLRPRRLLLQSISESRCRQNQSQLNNGFQVFEMDGSACPVEIRYEQSKATQSDMEDIKIVGLWKRQLREVRTDITDLNLKAASQTQRLRDPRLQTRLSIFNSEMQVRSDLHGLFTQRVQERVVDERSLTESGDFRYTYERTDELKGSSSFEAILYRAYERGPQGVVVDSYFLNGERISPSEYQSLLQDLENQLGLSPSLRP